MKKYRLNKTEEVIEVDDITSIYYCDICKKEISNRCSVSNNIFYELRHGINDVCASRKCEESVLKNVYNNAKDILNNKNNCFYSLEFINICSNLTSLCDENEYDKIRKFFGLK